MIQSSRQLRSRRIIVQPEEHCHHVRGSRDPPLRGGGAQGDEGQGQERLVRHPRRRLRRHKVPRRGKIFALRVFALLRKNYLAASSAVKATYKTAQRF